MWSPFNPLPREVGTVNRFELSLDPAGDLNALQAGSFTLATMTFDADALGSRRLTMRVNALGDADETGLSATTENEVWRSELERH